MVCSQSAESMDLTENWPVSIEVQLLGSTDKLKQTTGNICTPGTTISYKNVPPLNIASVAIQKFYNNEWVNLDIVVHSGKEIINIVNGDTVLVTSNHGLAVFCFPKTIPFLKEHCCRMATLRFRRKVSPLISGILNSKFSMIKKSKLKNRKHHQDRPD